MASNGHTLAITTWTLLKSNDSWFWLEDVGGWLCWKLQRSESRTLQATAWVKSTSNYDLVKFLLFAHLNIRLQFNLVAATDFAAYLPSRLVLVTHFPCLKNPNVLFLGNYPHVFAQNSPVFYLSLLAPNIYIYMCIYMYIIIHMAIGFWVSQRTKSVIHWSPAAATSQCRPRRWHKASKASEASEGARAEASSSLRKMTWAQGNCSTCPESNVINTHMDWWLIHAYTTQKLMWNWGWFQLVLIRRFGLVVWKSGNSWFIHISHLSYQCQSISSSHLSILYLSILSIIR